MISSTKATDAEAYEAVTAGLTVLLWSQSQNARHIEPLEVMLKTNWQAYREDRRMDYVVVHIGTEESCYTKAKEMVEEMDRRGEAREAGEKPWE